MPKNAIALHTQVRPSKSASLFSPLGAFSLTIGMVLVFFISQLLGVYATGKWVLPQTQNASASDIVFFGSSNGTVVSLSVMVSCLLVMVTSVLIIQLRGGDVRQYLLLRPFSVKMGATCMGGLLIFMAVSQLLTHLLDKTPLVFVNPLYQSVSSVWLLVFAMVVVAPLCEEWLFRGLLWSAIAEQFVEATDSAYRGAIVASIITSVIFAVIHVQYGIYEISTIAVLALIFCYARVKSGSLWLPILLHVANNGAAMWQYVAQLA